MQLVEVTLGREVKRPGPQQYSSDTQSAFVKLAVHPGDKLDDVLAAGRDALDRALIQLGSSGKPRAPTAAAAPFVLKMGGVLREDRSFKPYGVRWTGSEFEATKATIEDARELAARLAKFAQRRVTILTPGGDELTIEPQEAT